MVWKTLGIDPPVVNVSSRYGAVSYNGQRIAGLNNIELITDRPLAVNLETWFLSLRRALRSVRLLRH